MAADTNEIPFLKRGDYRENPFGNDRAQQQLAGRPAGRSTICPSWLNSQQSKIKQIILHAATNGADLSFSLRVLHFLHDSFTIAPAHVYNGSVRRGRPGGERES